jgi:hypothetical protein
MDDSCIRFHALKLKAAWSEFAGSWNSHISGPLLVPVVDTATDWLLFYVENMQNVPIAPHWLHYLA